MKMTGISGTGKERVQTVRQFHHEVLWPWPASSHSAPSWARSTLPILPGLGQTDSFVHLCANAFPAAREAISPG